MLSQQMNHSHGTAQDVDAIRDAPSEGVYVHGLFLDGCAWSAKENRLVDAEPKKLFHPLPVLYITAVLVRWTVSPCPYKCRASSVWCTWPDLH